MTPRASAIAQRLAFVLEDLRELERVEPADADAIVCTLVAHLRSWRPEAVSPLGTLPPPTERIRDPRIADEDIPWPSTGEFAEINARNEAEAKAERTARGDTED